MNMSLCLQHRSQGKMHKRPSRREYGKSGDMISKIWVQKRQHKNIIREKESTIKTMTSTHLLTQQPQDSQKMLICNKLAVRIVAVSIADYQIPRFFVKLINRNLLKWIRSDKSTTHL